MKARRWRRRRRPEAAELNITAYLNLMVILVPFLLVTAVFSRLAIIEIALPASGEPADAPVGPGLEVTIRDDRFEVADRGGAPVLIPRRDGEYNYKALSDVLKAVKATFPEHTEATILLEPDIPYEVLIGVMDATMAGQVVQPGSVTTVELFPRISVGDARPRAGDA